MTRTWTWTCSSPTRRAAVLLLSLALLGACRTVEETRNPVSDGLSDMGATPSAEVRSTSTELSRIQFDDIPCPPDFSFRNHRNESYAFVDGNLRLGRFAYWTSLPLEEAVSVFLEFMAKDPYNWSLVSGSREELTGPWVFEKNGERCEMTATELRYTPEGESLVTLTLGRQRVP